MHKVSKCQQLLWAFKTERKTLSKDCTLLQIIQELSSRRTVPSPSQQAHPHPKAC